jgi:hypothetical protein
MATRDATEQRLDDLYRDHPSGFVDGRNRLAKELRDAGERERADEVKKLRRPSAAAWALNRAALEAPDRLERFAAASEELEQAQARLLEGGEDAAADWRRAADGEREASAAVVEAAATAAREAGRPASDRMLELVAETLRAAGGDPQLRDQVVRGRVERERSAATLGPAAGAIATAAGARAKGAQAARGRRSEKEATAARRREAAAAQREVERLEADLADAVARDERLGALVERTAEVLRDQRAKLAAGRRETASLRRRLQTAKRRAKG